MKTSKKVLCLRQLGRKFKISHESTRIILRKHHFKYIKRKRKIFLTQEQKENRILFAHQMLNRESDWGFMWFSDESSFGLTNVSREDDGVTMVRVQQV